MPVDSCKPTVVLSQLWQAAVTQVKGFVIVPNENNTNINRLIMRTLMKNDTSDRFDLVKNLMRTLMKNDTSDRFDLVKNEW